MTDSNGNMVMPVAPYYGNGGYGNGLFGNGMDGLWGLIILLAVLGYGNGGGIFGGGNGGNGAIQRGFDQNAVMSGIGDIQQSLCNGFAGVNQSVSNGFAQAEISANARQIADMNQYFQMQTAFQNCCCENRLASANLLNTVNQDGAATRAAGAANTQAILDKLCQLELDGIKQNYEGQLRTMQAQLTAEQNANQALRLAASQGAQTAQIIANNEAQTTALEQYLAPVPRPAYVVQNPNCCGNQFGYGGCGGYAG